MQLLEVEQDTTQREALLSEFARLTAAIANLTAAQKADWERMKARGREVDRCVGERYRVAGELREKWGWVPPVAEASCEEGFAG